MKNALVLICLVLSGCYGGFQKRDGAWAYVEWNAGVGYQVSHVENADTASFRVLSDPEFAADKNAVYWRNWRLEGADPFTFRKLAEGYWRDRSKVWLGHLEIKDADPDSFRLLSISPWAVDKMDAFRGQARVHALDVSTFQPLSFHYARDAKAYYASGAPEKKMKIPCDHTSFRVLNAVYAKDKDRGYWLGFPIAGSDSETFTAIDENHARDKYRQYQGPNPK